MHLTFDWIINPIVVIVAGIGGVLVGFLLGSWRSARAQATIRRLEEDLVSSNHETLEAQKAFVSLEARFQEQQNIPVIPMKIAGAKDNSKEKATK